MGDLKNRKTVRMKGANYNNIGVYFITLCTKNRRCLLSHVVGTGVPDGPKLQLKKHGRIADKYIKQLNDFYQHISVKAYVIMPNHIHLLLFIKPTYCALGRDPRGEIGPSGTPVPTVQNSTISKFISTLKRFCNKEYGENIWQNRSYDHIIRNREDYKNHLKYIHENPIRWFYDELYTEE